jgi:CRP-like cAMP-binding protein
MADKSRLWYLENFNLFSGLKEDKMMELGKISTMNKIKKNEPVYFAKEPSKAIFFLKTGSVKILKYSNDGKEVLLTIINPGEVFGEMACIDEGQRTDSAITTEPSMICTINKDDLAEFILNNPSLNRRVIKLFGLKLQSFSERVEDLVFKDASQRIVSFMIRYSEEYGKTIGGQIFVKPFFKHQDIGELTACSRLTVNNVLTDLRGKNIIDFDRSKLTVNNMAELRKQIS